MPAPARRSATGGVIDFDDVPAEAKKLEEALDIAHARLDVLRCPECSRLYLYQYDYDWYATQPSEEEWSYTPIDSFDPIIAYVERYVTKPELQLVQSTLEWRPPLWTVVDLARTARPR